jgi:ABC-type glutathione transport system ATPase component
MFTSEILLEADMSVDYPNKPLALRNVTFSIRPGEVLGLVGESGSGKSTIALALLRLLDWKGGRTRGRIVFSGRDLLAVSEKEMEGVRGQEIGLVLQSPTASLNPAMRIGRQLEEAWLVHAKGTREELAGAVKKALLQVGLPCEKEFRRRYPAQISVGQAQRVLIAMAVMHSPALLIADEPTSALDAMTQVETLNMLATLNRSMGTAILYISHDLQSVVSLCQRVAILHDGEIVESGGTEALLLRPRHPYTQRLLACAPWLPWWLEQTQRAKPQTARETQSESVAASVHPAPAQLPQRLKSPGLPPMGW